MKTTPKGGARIFLIIIALIIIVGAIYTYSHKKIVLPAFSDYPAQVSSASFPLIDLKSNPLGSQFKTRISEANKTLPNFAGKYSIVIWGCGTSCQVGAIIDRSTGNIVAGLPFLMQNGYESKVGSTLLVVNPYTSDMAEWQEQYPIVTYYLNWNGTSFDQVGAYILKKDSVTIATSTPPKQL